MMEQLSDPRLEFNPRLISDFYSDEVEVETVPHSQGADPVLEDHGSYVVPDSHVTYPLRVHHVQHLDSHKRPAEEAEQEEVDAVDPPPPTKYVRYEPTTEHVSVWTLRDDHLEHLVKHMREFSMEEIKQIREDCPKPQAPCLQPRAMDPEMWSLFEDKFALERIKDGDIVLKAIYLAAADIMGPLGKAWTSVDTGREQAMAGLEPRL